MQPRTLRIGPSRHAGYRQTCPHTLASRFSHLKARTREADGSTGRARERTAVESGMVTERMGTAVDRRGSDTKRLYRYWTYACFALLSMMLLGCRERSSDASQRILGRWEVIAREGMNVPNSFFWLTMDTIEFREDGEVWALIHDTSAAGELRLNKTAVYSVVGENGIEFVGACRHQDPCTAAYTLTLKGDEAQIFDAEGRLELVRVGPLSSAPPPRVVGPSASATPSPSQ